MGVWAVACCQALANACMQSHQTSFIDALIQGLLGEHMPKAIASAQGAIRPFGEPFGHQQMALLGDVRTDGLHLLYVALSASRHCRRSKRGANHAGRF